MEPSEEVRRAPQSAQRLYDRAAVDAALDRMAAAVAARLAERNPLLLCVLNGGIFLCAQLMVRLDFPLQLDNVHATRYRDTTRGGQLRWLSRPTTPLRDRHLLIVDDILDEGHTLAGIVEHCRDEGAASVTTAVLVTKRHQRKHPGVAADIVGLEVEDRYVFGCGMDYRGYWRNCNEILAVVE